jgi:hypothetical protein
MLEPEDSVFLILQGGKVVGLISSITLDNA